MRIGECLPQAWSTSSMWVSSEIPRFCRRASPERISFEEPCAVMVLLI